MKTADKLTDELRIICSNCKRLYAIPKELMEVWGMIEVSCLDCGQVLTVNSLKEKVREEILEILEKSGHFM